MYDTGERIKICGTIMLIALGCSSLPVIFFTGLQLLYDLPIKCMLIPIAMIFGAALAIVIGLNIYWFIEDAVDARAQQKKEINSTIVACTVPTETFAEKEARQLKEKYLGR